MSSSATTVPRPGPRCREGEPNTLARMLSCDKTILSFMQESEVLASLNAEEYVGDAPARTRIDHR